MTNDKISNKYDSIYFLKENQSEMFFDFIFLRMRIYKILLLPFILNYII